MKAHENVRIEARERRYGLCEIECVCVCCEGERVRERGSERKR